MLVKWTSRRWRNALERGRRFGSRSGIAARLPSVAGPRGCLKFLLKEAGKNLLPPPVLRRRKIGFGVPVGAWLRGELRPLLEDTLLSPRANQRGYFKEEAVRDLVRSHIEGRRDAGSQLWALLWLELWHREFLDNRA